MKRWIYDSDHSVGNPSIYTMGGEGAQREGMVNPGLANIEAIQVAAAMRASDYIDDGHNVLFTDT